MISVVKVFNTIRDLCNEDQRGFVTPEVFNSFAEVAQESVFNTMKDDYLGTVRLRRSNTDLGGVDSRGSEYKEMFSDYLSEIIIDADTDQYDYDRAVFSKPSDLDKIVSIDREDVAATDNNYGYGSPCEIVHDPEKLSYIARSNLSAPTAEYPVALIGRKIEVLPDDVSSINVRYYRRPTSKTTNGEVDTFSKPRYVVKATNSRTGLVQLDPTNSRHFDLPIEYYDELISELAGMMGVRLRDGVIASYSAQQQAQA